MQQGQKRAVKRTRKAWAAVLTSVMQPRLHLFHFGPLPMAFVIMACNFLFVVILTVAMLRQVTQGCRWLCFAQYRPAQRLPSGCKGALSVTSSLVLLHEDALLQP